MGALRHWRRESATSPSRSTQALRSMFHSSRVQGAACAGVAGKTMVAIAAIIVASRVAHLRRRTAMWRRGVVVMSGARGGGRRFGAVGDRRGVEVFEQAGYVRHVDAGLLDPAVDVAHHEFAEAQPVL